MKNMSFASLQTFSPAVSRHPAAKKQTPAAPEAPNKNREAVLKIAGVFCKKFPEFDKIWNAQSPVAKEAAIQYLIKELSEFLANRLQKYSYSWWR